jgi:hypothetical protein
MPNLESQPLLPWDYQGGIRIGTTKKVKKNSRRGQKMRGAKNTSLADAAETVCFCWAGDSDDGVENEEVGKFVGTFLNLGFDNSSKVTIGENIKC